METCCIVIHGAMACGELLQYVAIYVWRVIKDLNMFYLYF